MKRKPNRESLAEDADHERRFRETLLRLGHQTRDKSREIASLHRALKAHHVGVRTRLVRDTTTDVRIVLIDVYWLTPPPDVLLADFHAAGFRPRAQAPICGPKHIWSLSFESDASDAHEVARLISERHELEKTNDIEWADAMQP